METTALIALSRQASLRREMDVVANNLANMNTTAFKGEKMMFVEHLVKSKGGESFIPAKLAFVRDIAQFRDTAEGPIKATGNPFDLAIQNDGYFVVSTENGDRFTRNGRFQLDQEGQLVTQHGHAVQSDAGAPFFFGTEDRNITISADGSISTSNGELGKIRLVKFDNEQLLQKEAGGLLSTESEPEDVERPSILQGALESSNIQPILELSKMIQVHRAFDSVKDFISKEDQRQKKMLDVLGGRR